MARNFSAFQPAYNELACIRTRVTYASSPSTIITDIGKLPAYASVIGGGVHIREVFNDSGTDTMDVGFRGGNSTDDPDAYMTVVATTAIGFFALDELAATTNIMQTQPCFVTFRQNGQNSNATTGIAYVTIIYSVTSGTPDGSS